MASGAWLQSATVSSFRGMPRSPRLRDSSCRLRSQKSTLAGASPCRRHCSGAARNRAVTVPFSAAAASAGLSCMRRSVRSQSSVFMDGGSRAKKGRTARLTVEAGILYWPVAWKTM
ncbi:hypothetical protein D3C72_1582500 [compost metagenome]